MNKNPTNWTRLWITMSQEVDIQDLRAAQIGQIISTSMQFPKTISLVWPLMIGTLISNSLNGATDLPLAPPKWRPCCIFYHNYKKHRSPMVFFQPIRDNAKYSIMQAIAVFCMAWPLVQPPLFILKKVKRFSGGILLCHSALLDKWVGMSGYSPANWPMIATLGANFMKRELYKIKVSSYLI